MICGLRKVLFLLVIISFLTISLSYVVFAEQQYVIIAKPFIRPVPSGTELFLPVTGKSGSGILKVTYNIGENKTTETFLQTTDTPASQPFATYSNGYEHLYVIEKSSSSYILRAYNVQLKSKITSVQLTNIWSQPVGITGFHYNGYDYVIIYSSESIIIYKVNYRSGTITTLWSSTQESLPYGIKVGGGAKKLINVDGKRLFVFAGVRNNEWYLLAMDLSNPDYPGNITILIKGIGGEPIGYDLFSYDGKSYLAITWSDSLYVYCFETGRYYKWSISPSLEITTAPSYEDITIAPGTSNMQAPVVVIGDNKGTIHLLALLNGGIEDIKDYKIANTEIKDLYAQMPPYQNTFWILFVLLDNGYVKMYKVPSSITASPSIIISHHLSGNKFYGIYPRVPGSSNVVYILSDSEILRIATNFGAPEKSVVQTIQVAGGVIQSNTVPASGSALSTPMLLGIGIGIVGVAAIAGFIVFKKFLKKAPKEEPIIEEGEEQGLIEELEEEEEPSEELFEEKEEEEEGLDFSEEEEEEKEEEEEESDLW